MCLNCGAPYVITDASGKVIESSAGRPFSPMPPEEVEVMWDRLHIADPARMRLTHGDLVLGPGGTGRGMLARSLLNAQPHKTPQELERECARVWKARKVAE